MPEDTKALKTGVLTEDEFLAQARLAGDENLRQYRYVLDRFTERPALLLLRQRRPGVAHDVARRAIPGIRPTTRRPTRRNADVVDELYEGLDAVVGETLTRLGPDDLLVVMSDHGFTSWRRAFHLNSWLRDNGYLALIDPNRAGRSRASSATSTGRARAPTRSA